MSYAVWCLAAAVLAVAGISVGYYFTHGDPTDRKGSDEFFRRGG